MTGVLYIDDQIVDLPPDESVKLTRAFIDLQNPESRLGDVSLPIKLPKTAINNIVLNNIQVMNVKDKFVRNIEHTARYFVRGTELLRGICRILHVTEDSFECTLASSNVAWAKELVGLTLRDLKNDDLTSPWHVPFYGLSADTKQYSINWYNENTTQLNSPICFPMVSYGSFFSGYQGLNIDGIYDDSIYLDDVPVSVYDLSVVERIFQNLGWVVQSPLFANPEHQKVLMPYTTADRYEYNYDQIVHAHASADTQDYTSKSVGNTFDYYLADSSVSPRQGKKGNFAYLRTFSILTNPHNNFRTESNTNLVPLGTSHQYYDTPISIPYNFDIDISGWTIYLSGTSFHAPVPTDSALQSNIDNVLGGTGTIAGGTAFQINTQAELQGYALADCGVTADVMAADWVRHSPNPQELKAGFIVWLDDPNDPGRQENVFRDVVDYMYARYDVDNFQTAEITNASILAAYFPTRDGLTGFFQPYNPNADIVVTGTTVYNSGVTVLDVVQCANMGPYNYGVNFDTFGMPLLLQILVDVKKDTYESFYSGNTRFEFRNIEIPAGEQIKVMCVSPGYTSGSTQFGMERAHFHLDSIDWNFKVYNEENGVSTLASPNEDDVDNLNLAKNMPPIDQLVYIKDWMARYDLFLLADTQNKVLRFDTYTDFFLPVDFAIDITEFIDDNGAEPATRPVDLPRNVFFKYNNDTNDALLKQDPDYANLQIVSDNIYAENDKTINSFFSASKVRDFLVTSGYNLLTNIPVTLPSIANDENYSQIDLSAVTWTFAYTPRILKLNGLATYDLSGVTYDTKVNMHGYPYKIMTSVFEDLGDDKLNLRWDTDNGLYATYYERFFSDFGDSHILELNSRIGPEQYRLLLPNVSAIVNNQVYFVNLIQNFDTINQGITRIELIKRFTN